MVALLSCCICKKPVEDYGNAADPIMDDICCNKCNELFVLPARKIELAAKLRSADQE